MRGGRMKVTQRQRQDNRGTDVEQKDRPAPAELTGLDMVVNGKSKSAENNLMFTVKRETVRWMKQGHRGRTKLSTSAGLQ